MRRQRLFYVLHNCRVPVYEKDVRMDTPPLSDLTRFFQATIILGFLLLTCSCQWEESAYWSQGWPINPFVLLSILQSSSIVILESSQCWILPKIWSFLPHFSRQNWRVIFSIKLWFCFWENERNNWEMFTTIFLVKSVRLDSRMDLQKSGVTVDFVIRSLKIQYERSSPLSVKVSRSG